MVHIENPDFSRALLIERLHHPQFDPYNYQVFIKREDLVHSYMNGNKWRKLKYNIQEFKESRFSCILSFGGAYSNHLAALSFASVYHSFKLIMIVRGERPEKLSPTLAYAIECGVELVFISRTEYRKRYDSDWLQQLSLKYNAFIIPEGGSNIAGVRGCMEIVNDLPQNYNYILVASATGGTLAGISASCNDETKCIGVSVLNDNNSIEDAILYFHDQLNIKRNNFTVLHEYALGGYAKSNRELLEFMNDFNTDYRVPIEPVYTGKLFYALFDLIRKNVFENNSKILLIHTGGLQYLVDPIN